MKLTNKAKAAIKPGMTLIELTVVIIVLLTLISVLFFAGTAYIDASNRTACLANQSNIQKGIRGYQNLTNQKVDAVFDIQDVVGAAFVPGTPENVTDPLNPVPAALGLVCPSADVDYEISGVFGGVGSKMVFCADPDYGDDQTIIDAQAAANPTGTYSAAHAPDDTTSW